MESSITLRNLNSAYNGGFGGGYYEVSLNGQPIGNVSIAKYGGGAWTASNHPKGQIFKTRSAAVKALIAKHEESEK